MRRLLLLLCLGLAAISPGQSLPKPAPDWMYDSVLRLKEASLLVGYPWGRIHGPLTRYEVAVIVHLASETYHKLSANEQSNARKWAPRIDDVIRLTEAVPRELQSLEVDAKAFLAQLKRLRSSFKDYPASQLGEPNRPFTDVPIDHWASGAIHALKRAGILVGYPDGKFKG